MVFPVVMYGCESWTVKKAERWRIDAFWCWRRLLRVPQNARRSNQSILKKISHDYSLEGLMLKLKLQYFGHLMWITDSFERPWCWERLKAGGEGDDRGWDGWTASQTRCTHVWASSGSWWWTGKPGVLWSLLLQRWTWLSDWTELIAYGKKWTQMCVCVCVRERDREKERERERERDQGYLFCGMNIWRFCWGAMNGSEKVFHFDHQSS